MAYNKVVYNNNTLIDLTGDTVTAADVAEGKTFHLADGSQATGTSQGGGDEPPAWYDAHTIVYMDVFYTATSDSVITKNSTYSINEVNSQASVNYYHTLTLNSSFVGENIISAYSKSTSSQAYYGGGYFDLNKSNFTVEDWRRNRFPRTFILKYNNARLSKTGLAYRQYVYVVAYDGTIIDYVTYSDLVTKMNNREYDAYLKDGFTIQPATYGSNSTIWGITIS